jgi:S-formylglutathione hydrolase
MSFSVFISAGVANPPAVWYLAGGFLDHKSFIENCSTGLEAASERGIALIFPDTSPRDLDFPGFHNFWYGNGKSFYVDAT